MANGHDESGDSHLEQVPTSKMVCSLQHELPLRYDMSWRSVVDYEGAQLRQTQCSNSGVLDMWRSEERRVGKECRN